MSANQQPPVDPTLATADAESPADVAAIPAFSFPFKPAAFAAGKKAHQPNYPGAGRSSHDKTPGRAPNGTRRSMGKR